MRCAIDPETWAASLDLYLLPSDGDDAYARHAAGIVRYDVTWPRERQLRAIAFACARHELGPLADFGELTVLVAERCGVSVLASESSESGGEPEWEACGAAAATLIGRQHPRPQP